MIEEPAALLAPLATIKLELDQQIAALDQEVASLKTIPGVGPALAFVLCLEDPRRFPHSRNVRAWVGLRPNLRESGSATRPRLPLTEPTYS